MAAGQSSSSAQFRLGPRAVKRRLPPRSAALLAALTCFVHVFRPSDWLRIRADLLRTTGYTLELSVDPDSGGTSIIIDGHPDGGTWPRSYADPRQHLAEFIDDLQEATLHEYVGGGCPTCPRHHTHPPVATARDDDTVWICPTDHDVIASVGALTEVG